MRQLKKHITTFLAVISVLGLIMSTLHTHSETLKCLEHPNEVHYSIDLDICEICFRVVQTNFISPISSSVQLVVVETLVTINQILHSDFYTYQESGRSPPYSA
ncbi:MAG: hypothetical protein WC967_08450 [Balneolaceae bacterium]